MQSVDDFLSEWTTAERDADVDGLATLLTDDFVGVGPLGFTLPKAAWLARYQGGDLTYDTFELDERNTRIHGDAAVVTARQVAHGAYQGQPTPEAVRATLSLVKDNDDCRLAGIHMSYIAGTPGAPPMPGQAA
jgi:ketosteroid isomerase-like protein